MSLAQVYRTRPAVYTVRSPAQNYAHKQNRTCCRWAWDIAPSSALELLLLVDAAVVLLSTRRVSVVANRAASPRSLVVVVSASAVRSSRLMELRLLTLEIRVAERVMAENVALRRGSCWAYVAVWSCDLHFGGVFWIEVTLVVSRLFVLWARIVDLSMREGIPGRDNG